MASYNICPFCGFKYPDKSAIEIELASIMFDNQKKKSVKTKRIKEMDFEELHKYWKAKGHKPPWLWRQLWYRGRKNSIIGFGQRFGWSSTTIDKAISYCSGF